MYAIFHSLGKEHCSKEILKMWVRMGAMRNPNSFIKVVGSELGVLAFDVMSLSSFFLTSHSLILSGLRFESWSNRMLLRVFSFKGSSWLLMFVKCWLIEFSVSISFLNPRAKVSDSIMDAFGLVLQRDAIFLWNCLELLLMKSWCIVLFQLQTILRFRLLMMHNKQYYLVLNKIKIIKGLEVEYFKIYLI